MGLAWELMSGRNNLYQNLTLKEQIEAGHQSSNMVPEARFEKKPVTWKLSPFYRPNIFLYGVCYTWTQEEQRKKGFDQFQFWAIVNLEPDEVLADKVEVKLVVHHKNYIPEFTTANGVLLEPGKDYELKLKQSTTETLPTPYGEECHNQNQLGMDKMICIEGCTQKELIDQCNCFTNHMKSNGVPVNSTSARPCGRYDTESYKCMKTVEKNKDKISLCEAKCVHPCRIVNYDITTTVKDPWPEDTDPKKKKNVESVFNVWSDVARRKPRISTLEKERKSLARVMIFFSSMTHVTYKQFPKIQDIEVFSYIGGYLGMWLGVSLLNCLDILDGLLVRLKKYKNKEVKTTEQQYSDKVSYVAVHSVSENF
ncbi:epithelial sodium channel subunit alpha-like [Tachypleus tridentatus]|uniref:epithelial sodium channel subunit alpha-like n=1 Tax=Tachypleus tridentatus TaxID=6853 RepID=UPI003FD5D495